MLKYMLDTDIVIYTMKNKPAYVKEAFVKHYGQMSISSITIPESASAPSARSEGRPR